MDTKTKALVPASPARQTNGLEDKAREAGFLSKETADFIVDFFRNGEVWMNRVRKGLCPMKPSMGPGGCPECQAAFKEPNRYGPVAVSSGRPPHLFELKEWLHHFFGASEKKLDKDLTLG